ncbi:DUF6788 family protein [Alicyclobacillus sp. ALC3]|uniref:DUF6788 family protein n=1 Tax=Alicyclobacillus sp. ALC3 TaxID=2796143 RepID=UPI002378E4FD|nr:DUF6788 family protein [Alicyclobacillus sp. ALC3]WDL97945.1 hypothetical protein JC200_04310 [Alicyclobacillus sp. ALC3]
MAIQHDGWSVVAQYRKCGKNGCKVCAEGRGHGPYYYGTKTVDGRRVSRYFGKNAPGEDTQENTSAEMATLRSENTRLRALVEELRGQLAKRGPSGLIEFEEDMEVADTTVDSIETAQDDDVHGLTANQQAVLLALRQECQGDRWVTALSLGRRMGYPNKSASSHTLPVLRRLATLGYAEEIERNKFKPRQNSDEGETAGIVASGQVTDDTQELTRAQVEAIWAEESALIDANQDVLQAVQDSFIRGLFRNAQDEHTGLETGSGQRPYVCPFRSSGRGAHRTFVSAERLVRTVVPWLIETTAHTQQHMNQSKQRIADKIEEHKRRYMNMSMPALLQLKDRMETSIHSGNTIGWTLSMPELQEQLKLINEVVEERR